MASAAEGRVLGISIGSTKGCVAIYKDDAAIVVANDAGDRVTPCSTTLAGNENALRVATRDEISRQGCQLIRGPISLVGRKYEEVASSPCAARQLCTVADQQGKPVFRLTAEKTFTYTPENAVATILAKLKESAKSAAGRSEAKDCVIAVPTAFTEEQRNALRSAAEKAGLHVLRLISEPASALLAYDIGQTDLNAGNVLVYDIGGTSVNATVVSVSSGLYRVIATHTNDQLGGDSFDYAVAKYFASEFQRKWRADVTTNKRSMAKLRAASELCRQSLSSLGTATAMVESLYDGMDFQSNLVRARFEGLCGPLFQQCLGPVTEVLQKAGLPQTAISKVVVTGGCGRMPKVRQLLGSYFNGKAEILSSISPDEVIAIGACRQANLLATGVDRDLETPAEVLCEAPCITSGIWIALGPVDKHESLHPVFAPLTPVPARHKLSFNLHPDQTSAAVTVCECLAQSSEEPITPVARVVLQDLPVTEVDKTVELAFAVDRSASLKVVARELATGTMSEVKTEAALQNGLRPEE